MKDHEHTYKFLKYLFCLTVLLNMVMMGLTKPEVDSKLAPVNVGL
jgi:hypothetical protein